MNSSIPDSLFLSWDVVPELASSTNHIGNRRSEPKASTKARAGKGMTTKTDHKMGAKRSLKARMMMVEEEMVKEPDFTSMPGHPFLSYFPGTFAYPGPFSPPSLLSSSTDTSTTGTRSTDTTGTTCTSTTGARGARTIRSPQSSIPKHIATNTSPKPIIPIPVTVAIPFPPSSPSTTTSTSAESLAKLEVQHQQYLWQLQPHEFELPDIQFQQQVFHPPPIPPPPCIPSQQQPLYDSFPPSAFSLPVTPSLSSSPLSPSYSSPIDIQPTRYILPSRSKKRAESLRKMVLMEGFTKKAKGVLERNDSWKKTRILVAEDLTTADQFMVT